MSALLVLALTSTLATHGTAATPACADGTTLDTNRCYGVRLERADADRARYAAAGPAGPFVTWKIWIARSDLPACTPTQSGCSG